MRDKARITTQAKPWGCVVKRELPHEVNPEDVWHKTAKYDIKKGCVVKQRITTLGKSEDAWLGEYYYMR